MKKSERIFRIIAVSGLAIAVVALVRREVEIKIMQDTYLLVRQAATDVAFSIIVENYDQE